MTTGLPFDDIRDLFRRMPPLDTEAMAEIRARDAVLTKPPGSLGRLETVVEWLGGVQGTPKPAIDHALVAVFAANHGVVAQGVSPYPASVTQAMVANFGSGGAAINQICATYGLGLKVFELALDLPTRDITADAAMDEAACAATMAFGMEAVAAARTCCASARWGSATRRSRRRSTSRCSAAPRPTGSGAAPASTTRGSPARSERWSAPWRSTRA